MVAACFTMRHLPLLLTTAAVHESARSCDVTARVPIRTLPKVTDDGRILFSDGRALRLSPSAVSSFRQCQLLFRLRHIERLPEPATPNLAAGNLVHETLYTLFQLPPEERKLDRAQNLFRELWRKQRRGMRYGPLFGLSPAVSGVPEALRNHADVDRERAWGLKAFETIRSYFQIEDPSLLTPLGCEQRVAAEISAASAADAAIPITGTIDRLDAGGSEGGLVVIDYKTGRSPPARFREGAFFQLEIYALLLRETGKWDPSSGPATLRLIFLGDGETLERRVEEADLQTTATALRGVWEDMLQCFRSEVFEPTEGPLCNWCAHRDSCPAFAHERPPELGAASEVNGGSRTRSSVRGAGRRKSKRRY